MDKAEKIQEVAARLGVPPQWLDGVIAFESRYNPQAQNPIPYNQDAVDAGAQPHYARGLIQFTDPTAQALGFTDSADLVQRLPDFDSQMDGAVWPYFRSKGPYVSEQDFYMTVFYPKYRRVPPDTAFPGNVQRVNPGIKTVQDYINKVNAVVASLRLIPYAASGLLIVGIGVLIYFLMR